jgi:hypothetical protein
MATYKKGYKKRTPEQTLLNIIVGMVLAVVLLVIVAFIYDLATFSGSYDDFTTVTKYENVIGYESEEVTVADDYLVYFYSDTCSACNDIKTDVLKLGEKINKDSTRMLIANTSSMEDSETYLEQFKLDINEANPATPMVVVMTDGEFEEVVIGSTSVVELLESVESGEYAPFN